MRSVFTFLFFAIIVTPFTAFSQSATVGAIGKDIQFDGVVMEQDSKQPLAYASIGVLNKPTGTVSDSLGHFDLVIGNEYLNDTLQVSMIGYYPVKISIREFTRESRPVSINLIRKIIQLKEVVILNQFQHIIIVGRQSSGKLFQASIIPKGKKEPGIGAESGLKIQTKHYPALLENFNFYVSGNNFKYIKFRLNIYSLTNNLPDTLLFNNEILASVKDFKTGWVQIDLRPYHMVVKSDFAVTLQWVDYNKNMFAKPKILIPVALSFSQISYFRTASQDKWNSIKANSSHFVTLRY